MQPHPMQNDARRARREQQLGPDAVCVKCGEADPWALISEKRSLLEQHHVLNRAHDASLTVPLCRNCHAKLTEEYRKAGASTKAAPTWPERLVAILRAVGVFLRSLGEACLRYAERLLDFIAALDARGGSWRTMPEAQ